jgi:hypothetical protein
MTTKQRREHKAFVARRRASAAVLSSLPNPNSNTQRRLRFEALHDAWREQNGMDRFDRARVQVGCVRVPLGLVNALAGRFQAAEPAGLSGADAPRSAQLRPNRPDPAVCPVSKETREGAST